MIARTSLRSRILLLLLVSVCAAIAVADGPLGLAVKEFHQREAQAAFDHARRALRDELLAGRERMERLLSALSGDSAVVASLNMISNYADSADYQPLIFDPEKKRLARELSRHALAGSELSLVAVEAGGEIAALAEKRGEQLEEGYVSYEQGRPLLKVADAGMSSGWQAAAFPVAAELARSHAQRNGRYAEFRRAGGGLHQTVSVPVIRFSREEAATRVGRITAVEPVGATLLAALGRYTPIRFDIVAGAAGESAPPWLDDPAQLSGARDLFAEAASAGDEARGWLETDTHYVQAYAVAVAGEAPAYFVLSSEKAALAAQVNRMLGIVAIAFILAGLLVVPLGLALAQRSVTRPVAALLGSVERIGAGDYEAEPAMRTPVREFARLDEAIRTMAATIRERESQMRLWAKVMENSREGIIVTDREQRIVLVNGAFSRITGYTAEEALGRTPRILQSGRHTPDFYRGLWKTLRETGYWQGELWDRAKDGRIYPSLSSFTAVKDAAGETTHYLAVFADLTEQKEALEHIRYLAQYDPLTRLPNRTLLRDRLAVALAAAARDNERVAVFALNLDRFKDVNDSLGLAAGDELLQAIAGRLAAVARDCDTVARLAADEFVLVLPGLKRADEAGHVARTVLAAVAEPLAIAGETLQVSACIGIAVAPADGETPELVLRNAEAAMFHAKQLGRAGYQFFAADMNQRAQQRLRLENELRQALAQGDFSLFYQPQVDIASGRVTGAEALIRWRRGGGETFVSPAEFIPVAEESGLILPIGEWVLREACRQRILWREAGLPQFPLAVNISAVQFRQRDFAGATLALIREFDIRTGEIELEVTESVVMHDPEQVAAMLERLKTAGFCLSIDDFGTGYSSLAYLKRFSLDKLKIDASFVRDIVRDSADLAIVHAVVSLGHSLGLKVVAEGVEGPAELKVLHHMGCDIAQGYHVCRPVPAEDFAAWLAAYRPQPAPPDDAGGPAAGGGAYLF